MAEEITAFPRARIGAAGEYLDAYAQAVRAGFDSVDRDALDRAAGVLAEAYRRRSTVWVCGNGGSAAISDHFACDHFKGVATNTPLRPRVLSLASNTALLTAIGNDFSFDRVFDYQLANAAQAGDVLVAVSSSGNSPNIVRAIETAKGLGLRTIGLAGFDGGRLAASAEVVLHVRVANYGVVEDVHQSLMHVLAQYLRMSALEAGTDPGKTKF
jgi:phosphoheptose isomerase